MSTVRVNDKIKQEIMPILEEIKRKSVIELNDGKGSYICEYGHLHNYKDLNLIQESKEEKTYNTAKEMMDDILKEE